MTLKQKTLMIASYTTAIVPPFAAAIIPNIGCSALLFYIPSIVLTYLFYKS